MFQNQNPPTLPSQALTAIMQALQTIRLNLPFLFQISAETRQGSMKVAEGNESFIEKALDYAVRFPRFMPNFTPLTVFQNWQTLRDQLHQVNIDTGPLSRDIDDTLWCTGIPLYEIASHYYKIVKMAADSGDADAQSIAEDLGRRFEGQGYRRNSPAEETPPAA